MGERKRGGKELLILEACSKFYSYNQILSSKSAGGSQEASKPAVSAEPSHQSTLQAVQSWGSVIRLQESRQGMGTGTHQSGHFAGPKTLSFYGQALPGPENTNSQTASRSHCWHSTSHTRRSSQTLGTVSRAVLNAGSLALSLRLTQP